MNKRFRNTQQPVGIHSEHSPRGMFLFGLPFVGCGIWITLIGLKIIEVDPKSVHAPYWLLGLVGLIFGGGGLLLWNMGLQQLLKLKRIAKQVQRYPDNPAVADYDWDPVGYSPSRWKPTFSAWGALAMFSLFGAISYWISFENNGIPWFVKAMSLLLGLIIAWVAFNAVKVTWHAFKYGKSQLVFHSFPIPLSDEVPIEIQLPMDLRRANAATLTLRYIEEYYEVRGSGKNRRKSLIQIAHYEDAQELTAYDLAQWPRSIRAKFQLPKSAQSTQLLAERPRYW